ncbi:MAG: MFS transporter [Actinobacteria bacterium]|nr:MFS transporter [Actinomycetota bacterium]
MTNDGSLAGRPRLSPWRFVVAFGVVSLLVDVVYEGARSIAGPFLGSLGASAVMIGAVTGAGEAAGLVLRIVSGPAADRSRRYWAWAIAGYLVTVLAVPALALPVGLFGAGALLITERVGKAVRSPAKDALLASAGSSTGRGKAFAVHEALDQAGAFLGPLLIAGALVATGGYRLGFALLALPGAAATVVLIWLARRVPEPAVYEGPGPAPAASAAGLPAAFWRYALFTALSMAGYATWGLIGYHLSVRGLVSAATVPLIYALAMATDAVAALLSGHLYDRYGFRVLALLPVLAGVGTVLAFSNTTAPAVAGALIWGMAMGVQESTLRAGVADLVPAARRAGAYGVFSASFGTAWFVGASLLGYLYDRTTAGLIVVCVAAQVLALVALGYARQATR